MTARPRSLVMDLFGDYLRFAGGSVQPSELIQLLGVFDVEPATTRVTVSRMKKDGWFTAERSAGGTVYQLAEPMKQVLIDGRRRIFTRADVSWDGQWTQVIYQVPEHARAAREALRKQLTWLGFGQFAPSIWLSPHDDLTAVEQLRTDLPDASIDALRSRSTILTSDAVIVQRCWQVAELARAYRTFIRTYRPRDSDRLSQLSGPEALRLRTAVVSDWRHLSFDDPLLPQQLLPADWPGSEAFSIFRSVHARLGPAAMQYVEQVTGRTVRIDDAELTPATTRSG